MIWHDIETKINKLILLSGLGIICLGQVKISECLTDIVMALCIKALLLRKML